MKRIILSAMLAAFATTATYAQNAASADGTSGQPQLIEKVTAKPGDFVIPFEKWRLPNGLTVIIHEDHSDPIIHVDVTYHVGSARETAGKSGFAHFFEHMMFQGSDHVADEEHFKIVQGGGGQMNGTTAHDRTNYYETLPKNYLETALWLESDRMGFLLDAVTQKKFEVQRSTVKNEKDQRTTNVPYGMREEIKNTTLYPPTHPYYWPTIGFVPDLDRVDVEDLKNFFLRWYGPNNASIVIAGDVNTPDALKLVEKYFGSIPRGPEVRKQRVDPVRLPDNIYANYGDNVFLPMLDYTYPTVPAYHPDEAALDVLGAVLGNGNNSIFYKNFVKSEKALQVAVWHGVPFGNELAGEFNIIVLSFPSGYGSDEKMEDLIKQTLEEFDRTGVDDDALARTKASFETNLIQSLQSIEGKSEILSQNYYMLGDKKWNMNDELQRYQKVTKEDVMRVFRTYVKDKYAAIVTIFPKQGNAAASNKEETKLVTTSGTASKELEYKGLSYKKPVDNFDRSKRPALGEAPSPVVPEFFDAKLDNGLKIISTQTSESPVVNLFFSMRGGNMVVNDPSKTGLASFTAAMMDEGTQNYTSEQFANEIGKLGSSISFFADDDHTYISVTTQKKNLDKTLALFEEKLLRPKFTSEDFKRIQRQIAESINSNKADAGDLAAKAFSRLVYGPKTMLAEPVEGTFKSVKGMSLKDIQGYYDKYYSPSVTSLIVVGDVSQAEIMPKLQFLNKWAKKDVPAVAAVLTGPAIEKTQIYLIDKYKSTQSEIRIGYLAMPYDYNGKFFKARVMNFPIAGNFNSRLSLNLREEKGYTYGINGGFFGTHSAGPYQIGCGVRGTATDSALKEIFFELNKYRTGGVTDEELQFAKQSIRSGDALRYETPFQKASFMERIIEYNLPKDYIEQQNAVLKSITKEEVNKLANELLPTDKMVIVVVGDKEKIGPALGKLGYKVVDYKVD